MKRVMIEHEISPEEWAEGVGPGWKTLVVDLYHKVKWLCPDLAVLQVKEKFGGLRFYVGSVSNEVAKEVFAAIDAAEARSLEICEECGAAGKLREDRRWLATLCDACAAEGAP